MTDAQKEKIDTQRDILDDRNSEIQRLHSRMELLDQADIKNFEQHKQILEAIKEIKDTLGPISETYCTVGKMAKWFTALLVFLSLLGGVIWTWFNILHKK
jgi:biotin synthase-like enzyme